MITARAPKLPPSGFNDATPASAISTAGAINSADHEDYTYDNDGNRLTLRKRDGSVITFAYDALHRMTYRTITPGSGRPPRRR